MIAIDPVLPDEQPRTACDQNRRHHRRVSNSIWQTAGRDGPDDEGETQKRNGVPE